MENLNQNVEPNVEANGTTNIEGKRGLGGGLISIIFIMIIGIIANIAMTYISCSANMWFNSYFSYISVAETSVSTLLLLMSIVAIIRRSDKAISLLYASLTAFIIAKISMLLASVALDSELLEISPVPQIVGLAIAIAIMFGVSNSDNCNLIFPRSHRRHSIFGWLLVALFVVIQGCAFYLNNKAVDDPASVFTSDKVYIECAIEEMNKPENSTYSEFGYSSSVNAYLSGDTLVMDTKETMRLSVWEELIEPTEDEKKELANKWMSTMVNDDYSKCFIETLVRNNYSIVLKFNINNDIEYAITLPTDYIKAFL